MKPLGYKSYGSIGHLPNSRLGPGDHCVPDGMAKICTIKPRDKHDVIIVQEKADGSCVSVANIDGVLVSLGRAGHPAVSSPYLQHRYFAQWVIENHDRFSFLQPGERVCGEWLAQAHGIRYNVTDAPFLAFDLFLDKDTRAVYKDFVSRTDPFLPRANLIHCGASSLAVEDAMILLGENGGHEALDKPEGLVYRVERHLPKAGCKVDFLAKYVRSDHVSGKYLPGLNPGQEEVWNWRPNEKEITE